MEKGEIVYCNLKLRRNNGVIVNLENCVFSLPYEGERILLKFDDMSDRKLIKKTKLKEDLKIEQINIIKKLGFKNKTNSYIEVVKNNNNKRNIMGGYD
jgi:hypothetical protein